MMANRLARSGSCRTCAPRLTAGASWAGAHDESALPTLYGRLRVARPNSGSAAECCRASSAGSCRAWSRASRARAISLRRVVRGRMTSSTKPRAAATYGFANFSRNSATFAARERRRIAGAIELALVEDVHRALRAHHRDLGRRPREVDVGADVLARHDAVRAAVGLARDHRDLRHRRLGERVEQLRAVPDDAAVLLHACPGRNPGTSSNVTSGMLNASQNRTKRAPLTDASMSSVPARCAGWLATMPTGRPPSRAKPTMMFRAKCACTSRKSPSSATDVNQVEHVVGLVRRRRARADRAPRPRGRRIGGRARAAARRGCCSAGTTSSSRMSARHSRSSATAKCATPLFALCVIAPPSSSLVTSSCVTVLITSGR